MTGTFDDDTALAAAGDGRWLGRIDGSWWVQRGPNGGYVAAIVLRAMQLAVGDRDRHPRALTVHYLAAPVEGEVEVEASLERQGRSLSSVSSRMLQGGRTVALAVAAFSAERTSSIEIHDAVPPELLPEDERPDFGPPDDRPPIARKWDVVPAIGGAFGSGAPAVTGGLIRLAERRPLDALAAVAAMDGWIPPVFITCGEPVGAPTVELTVHLLRPLPHPGTSADTTYRCRFLTETATRGHLIEDGELWAPDGTLLARSRQLALTLG